MVYRCEWLLGLVIVTAVGCSGGDGGGDRVDVYEVTGKVTMSGGPVANATVTLSPQEKQPVATGRTDNEGNFTLTTYEAGDGAAAGDYVVLVTKDVGGGSSPQELSHEDYVAGKVTPNSMHAQQKGSGGSQASSGLPEKYSRIDRSDLKVTVKPEGENVLNLELKP